MKIWIKLLAGGVVGVLLAYFLPFEGASVYDIFSYLSELIINIGRYALYPLVFFSVAVGTFELRQEKKVLKVFGRTLLYMAGTGILLAVIGAGSVLLMSPERIPIVIEEEVTFTTPALKQIFLQLFPRNYFKVFTESGNFLLPLFFLSFFLGLNFTFDRLITRPAVQFFDAMSRIFYHINSFVLEVMGIGMIALAAFLVVEILRIPELQLYGELIIVLGIDSAIVLFAIYPIFLYLLGGKRNPFRSLYAVLAPLLGGLVSGDSYFSLGFMMRNGKENLGVPRSVGSFTLPIFALFGRAGTALVSGASFIVILTSYSSLGISIADFLWVVLYTFLISFTLGSVPGLGAFVALSMLCSLYGGGYEEGYLIVKPIAPILVSVAVLLDVASASFSSMLIAKHENMQKEIELGEYM